MILLPQPPECWITGVLYHHTWIPGGFCWPFFLALKFSHSIWNVELWAYFVEGLWFFLSLFFKPLSLCSLTWVSIPESVFTGGSWVF
jgi:hypothetical protein